jgi:1,4-dihydroxy-2-naphthoyl-CoA hydrolase
MAKPLEDLTSPFDSLLGGELLSVDPDGARLRLPLRDELRQPFGLLHGGALSAVIEGLCSAGTFLAVHEEGMAAMGQAINVNFLRPVTKGAANVEARARHRGRSTWVWDAEVRDDDGKLCALGTMTIAVRPIPKS